MISLELGSKLEFSTSDTSSVDVEFKPNTPQRPTYNELDV
jgi:hypothetical protein